MARDVGNARPRSRQSVFQRRGFVVGVVLAAATSVFVPWLRSGELTTTVILFAVIGVVGSLIGGLLCELLGGDADRAEREARDTRGR